MTKKSIVDLQKFNLSSARKTPLYIEKSASKGLPTLASFLELQQLKRDRGSYWIDARRAKRELREARHDLVALNRALDGKKKSEDTDATKALQATPTLANPGCEDFHTMHEY